MKNDRLNLSARLQALIPCLLLSWALINGVIGMYEQYLISDSHAVGEAKITGRHWSGHGLLNYEYTVDGVLYVGTDQRDYKNGAKSSAKESNLVPVYYSTADPSVSSLSLPESNYGFHGGYIVLFLFWLVFFITVVNPNSGWALSLGKKETKDSRQKKPASEGDGSTVEGKDGSGKLASSSEPDLSEEQEEQLLDFLNSAENSILPPRTVGKAFFILLFIAFTAWWNYHGIQETIERQYWKTPHMLILKNILGLLWIFLSLRMVYRWIVPKPKPKKTGMEILALGGLIKNEFPYRPYILPLDFATCRCKDNDRLGRGVLNLLIDDGKLFLVFQSGKSEGGAPLLKIPVEEICEIKFQRGLHVSLLIVANKQEYRFVGRTAVVKGLLESEQELNLRGKHLFEKF